MTEIWNWIQEHATDIEREENPAIWLGRALTWVVLGLFSLSFLSHPIDPEAPGSGLFHLIHLPFHEAGHVVFQPFGRFIHVLGGTLMQLLAPLLVMGSFLYRRNPFGAVVGLFWLAHSFMDCAPYIDDARAGQLELLGGVTGSEMPDYHDWEVMLKQLGMLSYDHTLARMFWGLGALLMVASLAWGAFILKRQRT